MLTNLMRKCLTIGLAFSFMIITTPHAQERSAGGSLETQMTWSTLSTMITGVKIQAEAVNSRVDQSVICNKKFKVYAPGNGADGDGCIDNGLIGAVSARVDKYDLCAKQSRIYNPTTNTCVLAAAPAAAAPPAPNCRLESCKSSNGNGCGGFGGVVVESTSVKADRDANNMNTTVTYVRVVCS